MKARVKATREIVEVCFSPTNCVEAGNSSRWWKAEELDFNISECEEEVTIEGFVARDGSGPRNLGLRIYTVMPTRATIYRRWNGHGEKSVLIDHRLLPSVTWESEPLPVTMSIKMTAMKTAITLTENEAYALESAISELESLREGSDDMDYHKENKKITCALKRVLQKYNNNAR